MKVKTYLNFENLSFNGRVSKVVDYLNKKWRTGYSKEDMSTDGYFRITNSVSEVKMNNTSIWIKITKVNSGRNSARNRNCPKIKIVISKERINEYTRTYPYAEYLNENNNNRLDVSKLDKMITDISTWKATAEKQKRIIKKKNEFEIMGLAGKVRRELDLACDVVKNEYANTILVFPKYQSNQHINLSYSDKAFCLIRSEAGENITYEYRPSYTSHPVKILSINDTRKLISVFKELGIIQDGPQTKN